MSEFRISYSFIFRFLRYPNGDTVRGNFVNGLLEGYGKFEYAKNKDNAQNKGHDSYEGDHKGGRRTGFGFFHDEYGEYIGGFSAGEFDGFGVFTAASGSTQYFGYYSAGSRRGRGTLKPLVL
jgi:hypothetical protein